MISNFQEGDYLVSGWFVDTKDDTSYFVFVFKREGYWYLFTTSFKGGKLCCFAPVDGGFTDDYVVSKTYAGILDTVTDLGVCGIVQYDLRSGDFKKIKRFLKAFVDAAVPV